MKQCPVCYRWIEHVNGESCDDARLRAIVREEVARAGRQADR